MIKLLFLKSGYFERLGGDLFRGWEAIIITLQVIWLWLAAYTTCMIDPSQDCFEKKQVKRSTTGMAWVQCLNILCVKAANESLLHLPVTPGPRGA